MPRAVVTGAARPIYFATPAKFRAWLEKNHARRPELVVGFYKKASGKKSMTWPEAVDEALCFGWIDGVRHSVDDERYTNRFTPRRPRSNWSAVNIRRVKALIGEGRMRPAGLEAYKARDATAGYSYEQRDAARFARADERRFRADERAWSYFQARPASYRKAATWWVTSAKKPETQQRRLERLIADSRKGRTVPPLTPRRRSQGSRS
jgi:uncharacterized protein YdeI (YjbR/CyaY-like superfamily)